MHAGPASSQISPMTGLRQGQLEAVYSGGTVRDSHTVHYSSDPRQDVAADTADIIRLQIHYNRQKHRELYCFLMVLFHFCRESSGPSGADAQKRPGRSEHSRSGPPGAFLAVRHGLRGRFIAIRMPRSRRRRTGRSGRSERCLLFSPFRSRSTPRRGQRSGSAGGSEARRSA